MSVTRLPVTGLGVLLVVYVTFTMGLPLIVTCCGALAWSVGADDLSLASSARALATVGALPLAIETRTRLFLSWKETPFAEPFCVQPSG